VFVQYFYIYWEKADGPYYHENKKVKIKKAGLMPCFLNETDWK